MNDGWDVINCCILSMKYDIYKQRLFHDDKLPVREICNVIRYKLDLEKNIYENREQVYFGKYIPLCNWLNSR